jgi:hypothetical protein
MASMTFLMSRLTRSRSRLAPLTSCPLLHPEPIHLLRELAAELLEEVLPHQLVLQGAEDPLLNLVPRDRELVGACSAVASAEASELLA